MNARIRKTSDGYAFKCPGCGDHHHVRTEGPRAWGFNGNVEKPTFTPSLLVTTGHFAPGKREDNGCWCTYIAEQVAKGYEPPPFGCYRCHSYVRDGRIEFLGDCTHKLAGQTVDLELISSVTE